MKCVFDTSVVMAILNEEPGSDVGEQHLSNSLLSMVNFAEAITVLTRKNSPKSAIRHAVRPFEKYLIPVEQEIAFLAGALVSKTRHLGLSLGDRVCLATGIIHDLPVLTADTIWQELESDLGLDIQLIR